MNKSTAAALAALAATTTATIASTAGFALNPNYQAATERTADQPIPHRKCVRACVRSSLKNKEKQQQ